MLNREEKTAVVGELTDALRHHAALFLVDYRGVATQPMRTLRERLSREGGTMRVVKKTLLRRALADADVPALPNELLSGQVAVVYGFSDAVAVAKVLYQFRKELEAAQISGSETAFSLLGGFLAQQMLGKSDALALALLPSRQELLARMVGSIAFPLRGLLGVFSGPHRGFVQVLRASGGAIG